LSRVAAQLRPFILAYDNGGMAGTAHSIAGIMVRLALTALAVVIILLGLIVFSMPLPFGAVLILTGCALLVSVSETAALRLTRLRTHYPRVNHVFASLEIHAPGALGRALRRTVPQSLDMPCR
jgi:hypothetical protein